MVESGTKLALPVSGDALRLVHRQHRSGAALIALTYGYLGHPLDHRSLASLAVIAVVADGSGWLLAGRALRPLQGITATDRRVAERSLHERIALDEIKDLADTFDAMPERLDCSFDGHRRFVANACAPGWRSTAR